MCKTIHDVADAITADPSTGAWRSPMISSSENSTAEIGVLNAAAKAAAEATGIRAFFCSAVRPKRRPIVELMPAAICTEGPSRPREIPLASDAEQHRNFPIAVLNETLPSWR